MTPAEQAILTLVTERGSQKSICPTEAARHLAGDEWRARLTEIRNAAIGLARDGKIDILRKGKRIAPEDVRGVIRLRLPEA